MIVFHERNSKPPVGYTSRNECMHAMHIHKKRAKITNVSYNKNESLENNDCPKVMYYFPISQIHLSLTVTIYTWQSQNALHVPRWILGVQTWSGGLAGHIRLGFQLRMDLDARETNERKELDWPDQVRQSVFLRFHSFFEFKLGYPACDSSVSCGGHYAGDKQQLCFSWPVATQRET